MNELYAMSYSDNGDVIHTNEATTTSQEPLDTGHVGDAPIDMGSTTKKSKRTNRGVPKRGSTVLEESLLSPSHPNDNDDPEI
jgi:hypothetical protein